MIKKIPSGKVNGTKNDDELYVSLFKHLVLQYIVS